MSANETGPIIPIANKKFLCVEYPGYVRNTQRAIKTLGGENALGEALASDRTVTINYRTGVPFTHPTSGYVLPSSKLLVKVTRRVKKNKITGEVESEDPNTPWKTEFLGTIPKTLRFRALSDFQYYVPKDDRIRQLKESMQDGNVDKIVDFKIDMEDDALDNLKGIPPPIFTNHETVFPYEYRQNSNVVRVRVKQPDGSYKIKLVNRNPKTGPRITVIHFDEDSVPTRSWHNMEPSRGPLEDEAVEIVRNLFQERPIWTRMAARSCLSSKYHIHLKKALIASAYTFQSGPWRDTWVRYGVDPRTDQKFNIYQQIDIRRYFSLRVRTNFIKARKYKPVMTTTSKTEVEPTQKEPETHDNPHVFDGKSVSNENSIYQLCDIVDPDITPLINKHLYMKGEATRYSGFYYRCVLDRIRTSCRNKYLAILDGRPPAPIANIERGLREDIAKEIESNKKEDDGFDLYDEGDVGTYTAKAEQAAIQAAKSSKTGDSKRLKDVVDDYMLQLQKAIREDGVNDDDDDDDINLEAIDGLDDYDEEFAIEEEEEEEDVLEEAAANDDSQNNNNQEQDLKMEGPRDNEQTKSNNTQEEDVEMEEPH